MRRFCCLARIDQMCQDMGLVLYLVVLVPLDGKVFVYIITAGYDTLHNRFLYPVSRQQSIKVIHETSLWACRQVVANAAESVFFLSGGKH